MKIGSKDLNNLQIGLKTFYKVGAKKILIPEDITFIKKKPRILHQGNKKDTFRTSQKLSKTPLIGSSEV